MIGYRSRAHLRERSDSSSLRRGGDTAAVTWIVRGVRFSKPGLSGALNVTVTRPSQVLAVAEGALHLLS